MKKGFTLAELLGVIVVLSVLMLVAFTTYSTIKKNTEDKIDEVVETLIKEGFEVNIPNNLLANNEITNVSKATERRIDLSVDIEYVTSNEKIDRAR